MNIFNFEASISKKIVQRGKLYFDEGSICNIQQNNNLYEITIEGTEMYQVVVQLDGQRIASSDCTCPYTHGTYCKHEVAAFLAIQNIIEATQHHPSIKESLKKYKKAELLELLNTLTEEVPAASAWLIHHMTEEVLVDEQMQDRKAVIEAISGNDLTSTRETDDLLTNMNSIIELFQQKKMEQSWKEAIELALIVIEQLALLRKQVGDLEAELQRIMGFMLEELIIVCEGSELFDTARERQRNFQQLMDFQLSALNGWIEEEMVFFEALMKFYDDKTNKKIKQKVEERKKITAAVDIFERLERKMLLATEHEKSFNTPNVSSEFD